MRRRIRYLSIILMLVLLLGGCAAGDRKGKESPGIEGDTGAADINPQGGEEEQYSFRAEVIEAGDSLLIAPSEDSGERKSSDKITVNTAGAELVNEKGEAITLDQLKPWDILVITYNGVILESYPAQITASKVERVGHNPLPEGYLALIDDIYQEDTGLNGDIDTIALDTAEWTGVTDKDKEMIFARVKEAYGFEVIEGTFDELAEQGIINKEKLYFPKGILIQLTGVKYDDKKETITCGISKWRSGKGAIGANEVTARLKNGIWEITREGEWIS
ncbi:hypothetical protein HNQ56_001977 [Anaerotaenia torta]|uniref:hypothetical protein n=1 Tax=Anaerotaenia torta TaxID=433293 RepID=UPI003D19A1E2